MVRYKNDETNFKVAIWKTSQPQYIATIPKTIIKRLIENKGVDQSIALMEGSKLIIEDGKLFLIIITEPHDATC
jgi:hypothetical protein